VFRAAVHLITSTEGAANLEDVQRFHNRTAISLLAAETGMSADQVRAAIERRPSDYFSEPAAS
jgi:hypothetical protein